MRLPHLKWLVLVVYLVPFQSVFAQKAAVLGTPHDINGGGCNSCHAPHNGLDGTKSAGQTTGQVLLWGRDFSTVIFGTYDSPTMDSKAAEIGGRPFGSAENRMASVLCMSCHDGVTTPTVLGPANDHSIGNVANSFGLVNDHPVNMSFDPAKDKSLAAIANVTGAGGLGLFGAANTVQCASCHDPHDNSRPPFLRKTNTGSALCLTCHL